MSGAKTLSGLLFTLPVLALSACSFSLAADITPPPGAAQQAPAQNQPAQVSGPLYPLVAPDPQNGQAIYAEKCAPCHGESGKGDGPRAVQLPNPVTALGDPQVARNATPARWYTVVTQGNLERFMPPFSSLSDSQRWDVVAYAFSLSQAAEAPAQGQALYQANCARCHGEDAGGAGLDAAGLSTPPTNLTDLAQMAQKSGAGLFQAITAGGPSPDMPAFGDQLSEAERWALADYLRLLPLAPAGQPLAAVTPTGIAQGAPSASTTPPAIATQVLSTTAGTGTILGKITNGSGTDLDRGLVVTLHGFDQMQPALTATTTVEPDGAFAFPGIEMRSGRAFLAAVEYQQATYGSDVVAVEPLSKTVDLPITVFDTTTNVAVVSGDRLHLFFEFVDAATLRVVELYVLSNTSNKTLVAPEEGQPVLTFQLPAGAQNLQFQDGVLGGRYVETAGGFGDTAAIRPGMSSYQVLYAFEMPYDRKLELAQPISVPVQAVVILVPEGGIKIKSDMLQDGGTRDVQGTLYHTYTAGSLQAGDDLRLTVSGKPGSSAAAVTSSTDLMVGLGGFGLALIVAGVWLYARTRKNEATGDEPDARPALPGGADESAETVMDAILALDDLHQAGELSEEAYTQRRAELKARLRALVGGEKGTGA